MTDTILSRARRVAFQGEPGAYANLAAREALPQCECVPLHGRIADIHHLLPDAGLYIVGEHFHRVRHQLLAIKGATLDGLKTVLSQGPALGQCRRIIRELKLSAQNWHDTAGSARHVAELKDPSVAAIASALAAEFYGLELLKPDIEDAGHNMTRFLIMAPEALHAPHDGRAVVTTFIFRVRNVPAALYKAMGGFATNGVNLPKLESYQLGGSINATQFYVDIEWHPEDRLVRLALEELQFFSSRLTILGVYHASDFRKVMPTD